VNGPSGASRARQPRKIFDPRYIAQERRQALILACILFWSILAFLFIRYFFLGTVVVQGKSMAPTLWDGEQYLIHRWAYLFGGPRRGDIVVLRDPEADGVLDVKRVVALPNESVEIRDGRVQVNGAALEEPYVAPNVRTDSPRMESNRYVVEDGRYFVLGDNRPESTDSRDFGAVPRRNVLGRIHKRRPGG
jgi:signal peptidase I